MLYKVLNEGYKPIVLTFLYGQKHSLEVTYAQRTCDKLGLEHQLLPIPKLLGNALTDNDVEVPKEDYSVETQKITVVPNRNMIFLSIAASYAIAHKSEKVFYAAHKSDAMYPDCTKEFVWAMNTALVCGNYGKVRVEAPFIDMTKAEIVALGEELRVPFEDTWSCYDPVEITEPYPPKPELPIPYTSPDMGLRRIVGYTHCGVCGTCRERKRAFVEAGVDDPTRYAK